MGEYKTFKCKHDDCFTCPYDDCIKGKKLNKDKPIKIKSTKVKPNRKAYYKEWYEANKDELAIKRKARYEANKAEISRKRSEQYYKRKEEIMTHKERIRALIGNLKNHNWDIFTTFEIDKEDAEALRDTQALQEYINDKAKNKVKE